MKRTDTEKRNVELMEYLSTPTSSYKGVVKYPTQIEAAEKYGIDPIHVNRIKRRYEKYYLEGEEVYTPEEVAELLKVDKETVFEYIRDGKIKAVRLTQLTYRILKSEVEYLLPEGDR